MEGNNFWGTPRSSRGKMGLIARIALTLFATIGSIAMAVLLLGPHQGAHATTGINELPTSVKDPWGMFIDSKGNVWVAEPGCQTKAGPCTNATTSGAIEEFALSSGIPKLLNTYQPPTSTKANPTFLVVDRKGNVWFTDPTNNAIGELIPGTTPTTAKWNLYTKNITSGAAPYDLVLANNGIIWFTEIGQSGGIGAFSTNTLAVLHENPVPTANSQPYGITYDATTRKVWFAESANPGATTGKVASFAPNSTGILSSTTITEVPVTNPPHLITLDSSGNVWYSEGGAGQIGELPAGSSTPTDFSACPGGPCTGATFIAGIAVDNNGNVWVNDGPNSRVDDLNLKAKTVTPFVITPTSGGTAQPLDGLVIDSSKNVWFTEEFGQKVGEIPSGTKPPPPTPTGSVTSTASPSTSPSPIGTPPSGLQSGPVSSKWYFAEGNVGNGFTEYLTFENPDTVNACTVDIQYLQGNGNNLTFKAQVAAKSRFTESVNKDLNLPANHAATSSVSTAITIDSSTPNCKGVVAERPMYFTNFFGVSSGDDVVGATATSLGKSFYFADVSTLPNYNSFISILNPSSTTVANITATYYANGQQVGSQTLAVQPGSRGTITPTRLNERVAASVTSDQPVMVERPTYFSNYSAGNAGVVSGAGSVIGASAVNSDWRFAEGYLGTGFQEDLVMANFDPAKDSSGTLLLEYDTGATYSFTISIQHQSQVISDINQMTANPTTFGGKCISTAQSCTLSKNVSIEVTTPTGSPGIVAEREMYFHYNNNHGLAVTGGTDVTGQSGTASHTIYSFAEGYTNTGFNEWLTLQNPTTAPETIWVTLFNQLGHSYTTSYPVKAQSRSTVDITGLVGLNLLPSGGGIPGNEVSMTVQTTQSGAFFVAERPEYFSAFGTEGGSDAIGYYGQ